MYWIEYNKGGAPMYEEDFAKRLSQLRMEKGLSARDMSLSLGQNAGYINNIEAGKALPSMGSFFYICEYLQITPMDFFNYSSPRPQETELLLKSMNLLTTEQFESIRLIINELTRNK